MRYKLAKVLGFNTDQKASLAHSESSGEENIFLGLLNLTSDDAFTKGRQLLAELSDEYFAQDGQTGEKLENIFAKALENLKQTEGFDLLLAGVFGKTLYLLGHGRVLAHIKRHGAIKPLLGSGGGQLISGFLEEGDRVILATQSLVDQLKSEGFDYPFEAWEQELSSMFTLESQEIAALLIEVETADKPAISALSKEDGVSQTEALQIIKKITLGNIKGRLILAAVLILIIAGGIGVTVKLKLDARVEAEKAKLAQEQKKQEEVQSLVSRQANFNLFLDLDLIKKGFSAKNLSLSSNRLLTLDPSSKTLVSVDLSKKSHQILAGQSSLGDGQAASLNGKLAFVYSKDKGVVKIDSETQKAIGVVKPDRDWGKILDIVGFAGNIYLLDFAGQIWKYLPTEGGYSDKREYLAKGTKVELENALRMQIESSVYVLKSGGEILRFTRGEVDHFSIGGLDKGIKDPKSIFISSDTDNLYVLDSGNSRLVVLSKTGEYKAQYLGDKFGMFSDLVVDEKERKVYLLEGSKIYQVDLK
mgnify:CR=1 FL=1